MMVFHAVGGGVPVCDRERVYGGRNILLSYAYRPDAFLAEFSAYAASLILDNGAFSAWKGGFELDEQGFYQWVSKAVGLPNVLWFFFPDVIEGDEKENDRKLEECPQELRPFGVPVWHLHESIERLKRLCEEYSTVALGSSGDYAEPKRMTWWWRIEEAFSVIPKTTRIHGLRMLDKDIVDVVPLTSADSSTADRNASNPKRFNGPLRHCTKNWIRAEAFCSQLEGVRAPTVYCGPKKGNTLWGDLA